ncbi:MULTISPECIES: hypothetical protein [unclassified Roseovarius]|uniref:hypothetical protein n=1 Tax=unclassified Roseovarius TaxID=2614913 RepID=UPI00273FD7CB|nr:MULTISPECIES: hypothetical protein [unclassified Roseovarius]
MDTNELLVRTMNAAKEARERGFDNTASALDEIVESLLELLNSRTQSMGEKQANIGPDFLHLH